MVKSRVSHLPLRGPSFVPSGLAIVASTICSGGDLFLVHVIGIEFNLSCYPNDAFHASRSHGKDSGVLILVSMEHPVCPM